MEREDIKEEIIKTAHSICKKGFMDWPDYNESLPFNLSDALTIIVSEHIEDIDTAELYDFFEARNINRSTH